MRGLAVVIMIQSHTYNAYVRPELYQSGPYMLSQFVGGMAAPLFLCMGGMTRALQMDSVERREPRRRRRRRLSLRRALYVLSIAFAFRISNWVASLPHADPHEITKVDILNCMGIGLIAFSLAAWFDGKNRARFAALGGLVIAAAAPLVSALPWENAPALLHEYLAPVAGLGHFAFFPCAAYVGFGLAAGTLVKTTAENRFDRLMQWSVLVGFGLVFTAQYFSNMSISLYHNANFWTDSPALIIIRVGISLLLMAGSYLWTQYCAGPAWSWMQCLGKNSLMVYWVHVMLVYGDLIRGLKRRLTLPQTAFATLLVVLLMVALSAAWIRWKAWKAERWRAATTVASSQTQPVKA